MADGATIAAVLTSLGLGGLVGSIARGWQERSEKFRDRTIEACREWLRAHDTARRELAAATIQILPDLAAGEVDHQAADRSLAESLTAWRELQTHTFLVSLLLAGGTDAPAARAAQSLMVCYERWRSALSDVRADTRDQESAREIIYFCTEHALAMYNEFVIEVNEAIRPSAVWHRGRRRGLDAGSELNNLELIIADIRAPRSTLDPDAGRD